MAKSSVQNPILHIISVCYGMYKAFRIDLLYFLKIPLTIHIPKIKFSSTTYCKGSFMLCCLIPSCKNINILTFKAVIISSRDKYIVVLGFLLGVPFLYSCTFLKNKAIGPFRVIPMVTFNFITGNHW